MGTCAVVHMASGEWERRCNGSGKRNWKWKGRGGRGGRGEGEGRGLRRARTGEVVAHDNDARGAGSRVLLDCFAHADLAAPAPQHLSEVSCAHGANISKLLPILYPVHAPVRTHARVCEYSMRRALRAPMPCTSCGSTPYWYLFCSRYQCSTTSSAASHCIVWRYGYGYEYE